MKIPITLIFLLPLGLTAAPPVISNVTASQRPGTKLVEIRYNVADPDSTSLTIQVELSANGGQTYELPVKSLSGAVGAGVAPGNNRHIIWNAGADWNGNWSPNCKARIWAHDGSTPVPPRGMVYIPSGTFDMGSNPTTIGVSVTLTKSYFMDRTEVSAELWTTVRNWAIANGYSDLGTGAFQEPGHPIHSITWHDCIKWCNARSEMEGLEACYYTSPSKNEPYRSGRVDLTSNMVNWSAIGYRLPTEAEWERAARGGLYRQNYPWGNTIEKYHANFRNSGDPWDAFPIGTTPCGYYNGRQTPAGPDMANGFGLYDMTGNMHEACWDGWNGSTPLVPGNDPRGPSEPWGKTARGGFYSEHDYLNLRVGVRGSWGMEPQPYIGFRTARNL